MVRAVILKADSASCINEEIRGFLTGYAQQVWNLGNSESSVINNTPSYCTSPPFIFSCLLSILSIFLILVHTVKLEVHVDDIVLLKYTNQITMARECTRIIKSLSFVDILLSLISSDICKFEWWNKFDHIKELEICSWDSYFCVLCKSTGMTTELYWLF